jgi:hypothetical protein
MRQSADGGAKCRMVGTSQKLSRTPVPQPPWLILERTAQSKQKDHKDAQRHFVQEPSSERWQKESEHGVICEASNTCRERLDGDEAGTALEPRNGRISAVLVSSKLP